MTSDAQRNNGYEIPEQVDGYTQFVCYRVYVPDVREYRAAFKGQLTMLEKWWTWEKDGNKTDKRAVRAARYWQQLLASLTEDNCDMSGLQDVRQNEESPCTLEKTLDGSLWIPFANLQLCPPKIRTNGGKLQWQNPVTGEWEDLETGDERTDGEAPPPWPDGTVPEGEDGACLAAENIAATWQSALSELHAGLVIGRDVLAMTTGLAGTMSLFIPQTLIAAIAQAIVLVVVQGGVSFVEDMQDHVNQLKCSVKCHIEADGSVTAADFTAILADVGEWASGLELEVLTNWLEGFGSVGLTRQGKAAGITTGDCSDCDCDDGGTVANWHIPQADVEDENKLLLLNSHTGSEVTDGVWVSERNGGEDKDIIQLVTDLLEPDALLHKQYKIYVAYDHIGYYGSWQGNTFEGRMGGMYMSVTGNWYGGIPMDDINASSTLPIDGSEIYLCTFKFAHRYGNESDPEADPRRFQFSARNYNGWRITRIVEEDNP